MYKAEKGVQEPEVKKLNIIPNIKYQLYQWVTLHTIRITMGN